MLQRLRKKLGAGLTVAGSRLTGTSKTPQELRNPVLEPWITEIWHEVQPFTMTSESRLSVMCLATDYVTRRGLPGAIVECGVWRGGTMMATARTLQRNGVTDRPLWLYDTFEGMTAPTEHDLDVGGRGAAEQLAQSDRSTTSHVWAYAAIEDVEANLRSTGYESFRLIKGDVLQTIPGEAPDEIAILRLDTDWYESTKHELECLFDRLVPGGVLIVDDYGHWQGSRKALDEYLSRSDRELLLLPIDYTGVVAIV
jgi:O-methyltransferase